MKTETIVTIVITLLIGMAIGSVINISTNFETKKSEEEKESPIPHVHTSKVEASLPYPTIDLIIHEDSKNGYNLELKTTNFIFAPENIGKDNIKNQGHAYLYINGKKHTRIYSNWYYLGVLEPEIYNIEVSLNTNNHSSYTANNKLIKETEILQII